MRILTRLPLQLKKPLAVRQAVLDFVVRLALGSASLGAALLPLVHLALALVRGIAKLHVHQNAQICALAYAQPRAAGVLGALVAAGMVHLLARVALVVLAVVPAVADVAGALRRVVPRALVGATVVLVAVLVTVRGVLVVVGVRRRAKNNALDSVAETALAAVFPRAVLVVPAHALENAAAVLVVAAGARAVAPVHAAVAPLRVQVVVLAVQAAAHLALVAQVVPAVQAGARVAVAVALVTAIIRAPATVKRRVQATV